LRAVYSHSYIHMHLGCHPLQMQFMMGGTAVAGSTAYTSGPMLSPRGKRLLPPHGAPTAASMSPNVVPTAGPPIASLFSNLQAHLLRSPLSANASPAGSPLISSATTAGIAALVPEPDENKRRLPSAHPSSPLTKKARLSEKATKNPRKPVSKHNGAWTSEGAT
jgi:hypothetical protein